MEVEEDKSFRHIFAPKKTTFARTRTFTGHERSLTATTTAASHTPDISTTSISEQVAALGRKSLSYFGRKGPASSTVSLLDPGYTGGSVGSACAKIVARPGTEKANPPGFPASARSGRFSLSGRHLDTHSFAATPGLTTPASGDKRKRDISSDQPTTSCLHTSLTNPPGLPSPAGIESFSRVNLTSAVTPGLTSPASDQCSDQPTILSQVLAARDSVRATSKGQITQRLLDGPSDKSKRFRPVADDRMSARALMKQQLSMDIGSERLELYQLSKALGVPYSEVSDNYLNLVDISDPLVHNAVEWDNGRAEPIIRNRLASAYKVWRDELSAPNYILKWITEGVNIRMFAIPRLVETKNNKSALMAVPYVNKTIKDLLKFELIEIIDHVPAVVNPLSVAYNARSVSNVRIGWG